MIPQWWVNPFSFHNPLFCVFFFSKSKRLFIFNLLWFENPSFQPKPISTVLEPSCRSKHPSLTAFGKQSLQIASHLFKPISLSLTFTCLTFLCFTLLYARVALWVQVGFPTNHNFTQPLTYLFEPKHPTSALYWTLTLQILLPLSKDGFQRSSWL